MCARVRDCCGSGHFKNKRILKEKIIPISVGAHVPINPGMRTCAHAQVWFGSTADKMQSTDSHSVEEVGEVESNPVSKAIARHLGIDISAEGRLAKNRKGIAIIVYGTPVSGMQ